MPEKESPFEKVSLSLLKTQVSKIGQTVQEGKCGSNSELVRKAIDEFFERHPAPAGAA